MMRKHPMSLDPRQLVDDVLRSLDQWLIARTVPTATDKFRNDADDQLRIALLKLVLYVT